MFDLLLTSRKEWAVLIGVVSLLGAAAALAFGDMTPRSFAATGIFVVALLLSIAAVRPRRAIGVPVTVVSGLLVPGAVYVLVAGQIG